MKVEELYQVYKQYPSVQTDTRKLKSGDLYFALKGPHFNGNAFAAEAIAKGAAFAVIDDENFHRPGKTILVEDVLFTIQQLALYHRQQFNIPFLAITGSNGKTTTKELVHAVLAASFQTYTTTGNLNNHIGVPLTILGIRRNAEIAVIEMGANHIGEIAAYCTIALPTHGLITNCGKAHLEGFGSEEGVRKGKGELFDHLRDNGGTAFIMSDYEYLQEMSKGIREVISYGTRQGKVTGSAINSKEFLEVDFTGGFQGTIRTNLVGKYNLPNVLAAVTVGKYFNVDEEKIKAAIENYSPTNSRSQLVIKGSNKIIMDAYNANPSSMKAAIENFASVNEPNKIIILGSMAELGDDTEKEHAYLLDQLKKHSWKQVILVGKAFSGNDQFLFFDTPDEAGEWLQKHPVQQAHILIKGSRSMQMEKLMQYL